MQPEIDKKQLKIGSMQPVEMLKYSCEEEKI